MFLGHLALAFAAKRAAPRTSLGTLIFAALLPDVIWIALVFAGVERMRIPVGAGPAAAAAAIGVVSWPWSHSLLMVLLWATAAAAIHRARTGYRAGTLAVFALVASHWILEALTHRSDLPIAPGLSARVGAGLGAIPAAMIALHAAVFFVGLALYLDLTRPVRWEGRFGLLAMVAFACFLFLGSTSGAAPPGPRVLIATTMVTWAFIPWGGWVDRFRRIPRRA